MKNRLIVIGVVVLCFVGIFGLHYFAHHSVSRNVSDTVFTVAEGDDMIVIGRKLEKADLINHRIFFYYYAWKNKLRGKFIASDYVIVPHSTMENIVYKLTRADEALVEKKEDIKITFPEGWTMEKMAKRLNKNHLPGDAFLVAAQQTTGEFHTAYPFLHEGANLEGYLFPDTYFFEKDATAEDIITTMLKNFNRRVDHKRRENIAHSGRNLHDVIIFASVIEGEVPQNADRSVVAGVFQNRLDINMALQSDATIDYIKGTPEIKHTYADTQIDSPYNTYLYPGLPVGPINSPSLASIDAAIAPQDTDYLYFLNNPKTGETIFSRTNEEHNRNKDKHGL